MPIPVGFFGLSLEAGKMYSQQVETSFKLTMAALDSSAKEGQRVTLFVKYEDEQDSESEEESTPEESQEFALCTLTAGKTDQQPLDLTFCIDEKITLFSRGEAQVHLTGYHVIDEMDNMDDDENMDQMYNDDESDSQDDEEEEMTEETKASFRNALEQMRADGDDDQDMNSEDFEDLEDDEEIPSDEDEEEIDEELLKQLLNQKRKMVDSKPNAKKLKTENKAVIVEKKESKKDESKSTKETKKAEAKVEKESKKTEAKSVKENKKTEAKPVKESPAKESTETVTAKAAAKKEKKQVAPTPPQEEAADSKKRTLPSGLIIEDELIGKGPKAKNGKKVSVRYIGKLMNGKTFDSNVKGAPFTFKLGGGEVIKGWDIGVAGMHVGGTRKLTIPAAMAYGAKGAAPDIPSNATLQFEVKLLDIKN